MFADDLVRTLLTCCGQVWSNQLVTVQALLAGGVEKDERQTRKAAHEDVGAGQSSSDVDVSVVAEVVWGSATFQLFWEHFCANG